MKGMKLYEDKRNDLSGYRSDQRTAHQSSDADGSSETGQSKNTEKNGYQKTLKKKFVWSKENRRVISGTEGNHPAVFSDSVL